MEIIARNKETGEVYSSLDGMVIEFVKGELKFIAVENKYLNLDEWELSYNLKGVTTTACPHQWIRIEDRTITAFDKDDTKHKVVHRQYQCPNCGEIKKWEV